MTDPCRKFRERWLERALDRAALEALEREAGHPFGCAACRAWIDSRRAQVEALSSLAQPAPPERLRKDVSVELVRPALSPRLERAVRSLQRLPVPARLAELVSVRLEEAREDHAPVSSLEAPAAPRVLERLVSEELAEPEAHRADRFVGSLEPVRAPSDLDRQAAGELARRPRRGVWAPLAGLAAAFLVVWVSLRGADEPERVRAFRVVRAQDVDELPPFARGLAAALSGGLAAEMSPGLDGEARNEAMEGRR